MQLRQQTLNKHLNALKKIAEEFNLAVVIVNQVTADPVSDLNPILGLFQNAYFHCLSV